MGGVYTYVRYELGRIATAPSNNETPPGGLVGSGTVPGKVADQADGLKPENILLIGNETRQGLTPYEQQLFGSSIIYSGTLADIIMVLHLDPAKDTASILSIPRDVFVPMPAGSPVGAYQKVDAALNDGADGPNNLIAAIQDDFGIAINHFVELNFNGLINVINAIGGINVYFPDPVYDADSLLYIPTSGCHHLNGFYSLTLVRARHLQYDPPGDNEPREDWPYDPESDLARILRTHTFLKIVADKVRKEGLADPLSAPGFLSAIVTDVRMDQGLKNELLSLVIHYRHVNLNTAPETTLPTSSVNGDYYFDDNEIGDVLFPVEPNDLDTIRAWDSSSLPTPVAPQAVSVVSIAGSAVDATSAGQALSSDGLHVTSATAGDVPSSTTETYVVYHKGQVAEALDVMKYLSGSVVMQLGPSVPAGTVQVQLGSVYQVTSKKVAPAPTTATTSPASSTSSTTTAPTSTSSTTKSVAHMHVAAPTTTVPTPDGNPASSASGAEEPWDPRACPS